MRIDQSVIIAALCALAACSRQPAGPPYSAADSLKMMAIPDGYRVEPFAAEPDVVSPAAMEIDEDGRVYVVEDRGYPLNVEGKVGRVKLIDNGRVTVFADKLTLPTGVMRWKKGILVTDAPDVLYLEDSDGDGKADIKKTVLTGFPLTNPQHTVNTPVYGLDNWIYIAHENPTTAIIFPDKFGDRGSDIRFGDKPEIALKERGRNVRFRPESHEIEALAGPSQFGQAFDDYGRHFVLNNTYHARHAVIEARYLRRNPYLAVAAATQEISDHGTPAKVYPIVPKTRFEMLTNVGEFTSACGLTFWRGGAFVAEPAHNLVHRDLYSADGPTFKARRDREGVEFLASKDPWFRPVNFYVGPDNALYLLDYYRLVIEHPEWMATETYHSKEIEAGIDRGRIYRITPSGAGEQAVRPKLSQATTAELVGYLANENLWWRRTAQRLLVDRRAADAVPLLVEMARSHKAAVARLHALYTLDGLGKLETALIENALRDNEAGVRENAIKLAEKRLVELGPKLPGLKNDPDARVRFQLLCTLGMLSSKVARDARDELLVRDLGDRWMQIAALSASAEDAPRLLRLAVEKNAPGSFFRQAASVIALRQKPQEIQGLLTIAGRHAQGAAALEGLATGLRGAKLSGATVGQLLALFERPVLRRAALHVLEAAGTAPAGAAVERAAATAANGASEAELRADSLSLVALSNPESRRAFFERMAGAAEPEAVQIAAVKALGRIPGEATATFLLGRWREFTAGVRMEAADALYRDPARLPLVLAALKSGDIQPWTLAFRHRSRLVMHRDPAVREAARALFESTNAERAKVMAQYQPTLEQAGDARKGEAVFKNICAKCHKLNGVGADVGPDLATMRGQPKQALLEAILIPSKSISQGFEAYVIETTTGGTFDGVIGAQTATAVSLRREEGKEDVIPRKDIKTMYATNLSGMPGDLEKQITAPQMADLLAYLKQ
jgi:putative membrane-bound dehydrogenase-like protein